MSPTRDEAAHLAAGIEYWRTGRAELYNVNPPLVRLWATLPIAICTDLVVPRTPEFGDKTVRQEFVRGKLLRDELGNSFLGYLNTARYMCVPIVLLGTLGVYLLARQIFCETAGTVAAAAWALNPIVLGYGALYTCDIAAGSAGVWAVYAGLLAHRHGTPVDAIVAGVLLGFAIATKSVWIIAILLWPIGAILLLASRSCVRVRCLTPTKNPGPTLVRTASRGACLVLLILLSAWLVVLGSYRFVDTFRTLDEFEFVSDFLNGGEVAKGNRFVGTMLGRVPVPFPGALVRGIDQQWQDFDEPSDSFLFGQWQQGGWWYYYLMALSLKLPLGLLAMVAISILTLRVRMEALLVCFGIPAVLFLLVSAKTNMNEHTRYLWSALPFIAILASGVFVGTTRTSFVGIPLKGLRVLSFVCLIWIVHQGFGTWPFGLSYSNELTGGPSHTSKYLAGSNVDWNHGWLAVRDWLSREGQEMPCVLVEPDPGYFDCIGIPTSQSVPRKVRESGWEENAVILISTENRMGMSRPRHAFEPWVLRDYDLIGCCVEKRIVSFEEATRMEGVRWYSPSGTRDARSGNGDRSDAEAKFYRTN
ncbi:MAG: glycosyltransferase family 39 protein [Pirellulaceae bacterium]